MSDAGRWFPQPGEQSIAFNANQSLQRQRLQREQLHLWSARVRVRGRVLWPLTLTPLATCGVGGSPGGTGSEPACAGHSLLVHASLRVGACCCWLERERARERGRGEVRVCEIERERERERARDRDEGA
eukprot:3936080-Rhodomonas_salina.2